ncbi:hypothetical protein [Acidithiobacillus sulfuriphilus]|uniref:hypothetical protein n=1 Tax=Acidithiobacillus sulfuriphilus TaxID=1867749 RepID=UPI003F622DE3
MANIAQIRGALLEEAVLFLLKNIDYEPYDQTLLSPNQLQYMRAGHSGLEIRGRGTWHQLDAFALWKHSPAFMYPLHIIVEAKCYAPNSPVCVDVPRNIVGVLKDISENYFSYEQKENHFHGPRYNYAAAIFSTSGFTKGAVEYAVAHQVFLIQYENVPVIQPLIDAIRRFDKYCISYSTKETISSARSYFRRCLAGFEVNETQPTELTEHGKELLSGSVTESCRAIKGSYFGMLQGQWPLHLLRREPLPPDAFSTDVVYCQIKGNNSEGWKFTPINSKRGDQDWFELEFSLPKFIAELVDSKWDNPIAVANLKQQHFSFIDLSGVIGGIRRSVRLQLDRNWIDEYISKQYIRN